MKFFRSYTGRPRSCAPFWHHALVLGALALLLGLLAGCNLPASLTIPTPTPPINLPNAGGPAGSLTDTPTTLPAATLAPITPQATRTLLRPTLAPIATLPPTADTRLQAECLIGTWEVTDLGQAMTRSYTESGSSLRLQDVQGQVLYEFDSVGAMTILFQRLVATFTGQVEQRSMVVEQAIEGSGTASYRVDPVARHLIMSEFGGEGVLTTLTINGQQLAEGNLPVWQAFTSSLAGQELPPAGQVVVSRTAVTCQGERMTLQAIDPLPGPVIELRRVP